MNAKDNRVWSAIWLDDEELPHDDETTLVTHALAVKVFSELDQRKRPKDIAREWKVPRWQLRILGAVWASGGSIYYARLCVDVVWTQREMRRSLSRAEQ